MKKISLIILFFISALSLSLTAHAATNQRGAIQQVNYNKLDIKIAGVAYKLSNTVRVFGLGGDKYLAVKKLHHEMYVKFKYSSKQGVNTISDIWVQPN